MLDLCGRSSMGVNLQSARLIWESSRDVTHEELEPRESTSRTISSGLLGDWTFETNCGVSKSAP